MEAKGEDEDARDSYKYVTINAQILENKINELQFKVDDTKPEIVGVTETWRKLKNRFSLQS